MSLSVSGRLWKTGDVWRAELREFELLVKAASAEEAVQKLKDKLDDISDQMEYELTTSGAMDGPLIFETDESIEAALLIIKRRIMR